MKKLTLSAQRIVFFLGACGVITLCAVPPLQFVRGEVPPTFAGHHPIWSVYQVTSEDEYRVASIGVPHWSKPKDSRAEMLRMIEMPNGAMTPETDLREATPEEIAALLQERPDLKDSIHPASKTIEVEGMALRPISRQPREELYQLTEFHPQRPAYIPQATAIKLAENHMSGPFRIDTLLLIAELVGVIAATLFLALGVCRIQLKPDFDE